MANTQKKEQVSALQQFLSDSVNFTLVKYDKTPHIAMEGLRKSLKQKGASLQVLKNTLFEKTINKVASSNIKNKDLKKIAKVIGNNGIIGMGTNWSESLKSLQEFTSKDKTISFGPAFFDGIVYEANQVVRIADLPPRPQLVAKLLGTMKSPMYSMVRSLTFHQQQFVFILSQASQKTS